MSKPKKSNTELAPVSGDTAPELQNERQLADSLQKQYTATLDAQEHAVREAVKFGMMLREIEVVLTCENNSPRRGPTAKGTGLQAWLAEHSPSIDYQKAMRWKRAAERVSAIAELPQEANWTEVLHAPPDSAEAMAVNTALDDEIGGRSLRQLMFDFAPESPSMAKAREELYAAAAAKPDDPNLKQCVQRVETGELPVNRWKPAYVGLKETKDQERPATNYTALAKKNLGALNNALVARQDAVSGADKEALLIGLARLLASLPDALHARLLKLLPEDYANKKVKKGIKE